MVVHCARLMLRALQAIVYGAGVVARSPGLILIVYIALVAAVVPAAAVVARDLDASFKARAIERVMPAAVDAGWFSRANALSPAIIGFAAQRSNLDDLINGAAGSRLVVTPLIVWFVVWTLVLGGVLHRFAPAASPISRGFMAAALRCFPRFAAIAVATLAVYAMAAAAYTALPPNLRFPLLAPLVGVVAITTLIASYARAHIAIEDARLPVAIRSGVSMLRRGPATVATHALVAFAAWIAIMMLLALIDRTYGAGTGIWRPLLVAQAYVIARIVLRLIWEASAVSLVSGR